MYSVNPSNQLTIILKNLHGYIYFLQCLKSAIMVKVMVL